MTIQKRMRWRDYAEAYPCEECGNPPTKEEWRAHNAWVDKHALWHREAGEEELRKHEAECRLSAAPAARSPRGLLPELRPQNFTHFLTRVALHTSEPPKGDG